MRQKKEKTEIIKTGGEFLIVFFFCLSVCGAGEGLSRRERFSSASHAQALFQEGKYAEAASFLEKAVAPGAQKRDLIYWLPVLGRCYEAVQNYDKAIAAYQQAYQLQPKNRERMLDLARLYGRVDWSVRGIYDDYTGWYDGWGTGLFPLPPEYRAREMVDLAGGAYKILARAIELQKRSEHQLTAELCDVVIQANPHDRLAHVVKAHSMQHLAFNADNLLAIGSYLSAYSMHMKAAEVNEREK